jgi:molybdopterin synthase sulfur carrier subunit
MVRLLYFAQLAERLGCTLDEVELPAGLERVGPLCNWLQQRSAVWGEALALHNVRITVNKQFAQADTAIKDGDEIAFFPALKA